MSGERPPAGPGGSGQRCLITGATGFIGSHIVQRLAAEGYRPRCLVRRTSETSLLRTLGAELVEGELTAPETLPPAVNGCRLVVHCAALVSDWATPQEITSANVSGTRNLLDACAGTSVTRFVHVSTTDVYGHPGGRDVDERHQASGFSNWYAQTKLAAEAEVKRAAAERALETVVLRPATVYGPRSREVILEITRAIRGGHMLLIDQGRAIAGLCYVQNLVDAVLLAIEHPAAVGEAFNVTDGLAVTWRELTDALAAGLDCPPPRFSIPRAPAELLGRVLEHGYRGLRSATGLTTRPLLSRQAVQVMGVDQSFSNLKARSLLGWEPRVDYYRGLELTLDWLRSGAR